MSDEVLANPLIDHDHDH